MFGRLFSKGGSGNFVADVAAERTDGFGNDEEASSSYQGSDVDDMEGLFDDVEFAKSMGVQPKPDSSNILSAPTSTPPAAFAALSLSSKAAGGDSSELIPASTPFPEEPPSRPVDPLVPTRVGSRGSRASMTEDELRKALASAVGGGGSLGGAKILGSALSRKSEMVQVSADIEADEKVSYVPAALARAKLEQVRADMKQMKLEHERSLADLAQQYCDTEVKVRQHYASILEAVKTRGMKALAFHKREISRQKTASEKSLAGRDELIEDLRDRIASLTSERKASIETAVAQHMEAVALKEKEMLDLQLGMQSEILRLEGRIRTDAEELAAARADERAAFELALENRRVESERETSRLRFAMEQVAQHHAAEKLQLSASAREELRRAAELGAVQLTLAHLVGEVEVRSVTEDLQRARHKAKRLQASMTLSQSELQSLRAESQEARAQMCSIQQAFDHLKEELRLSEASREELRVLAATSSIQLQTPSVKAADKQAALHTASAGMERLNAEIKAWTQIFERREGRPANNLDKLAIKDLFSTRKLLGANTDNLTADLGAASSNAIPEERSSTSVQLQKSEAALDGTNEKFSGQQATQTANLPAASTLGAIEQLEADLAAMLEKKKRIKSEVKDWMQDFELSTGRPPDNSDKLVIKDKFREHKLLEASIKRLIVNIEEARQQISVQHKRGDTMRPESNEELRTQLSRASQQLTEARAAAEQLKVTVADLTATSDGLVADVSDSTFANESRTLLRRLEVAQIQIKSLHTKLEETKSKGAETTQALRQAEKRIQETEARANLAETEIDSLRLVVDEDSEVNRLRELVKKLKAEVIVKSRAASVVWDAAEGSEVSLTVALERHAAPLYLRIGELEEHVKTSQSAYDTLQCKTVELEKMVSTLQEQCTLASGHSAKLNTKCYAESSVDAAPAVATPASSHAPACDDVQSTSTKVVLGDLAELSHSVKETIKNGAALWKSDKRNECFLLYMGAVSKVLEDLPALPHFAGARQSIEDAVVQAREKKSPAKGAVVLRKALDTVLAAVKTARSEPGVLTDISVHADTLTMLDATHLVGGADKEDMNFAEATVRLHDGQALGEQKLKLQQLDETCKELRKNEATLKVQIANLVEECQLLRTRVREDSEQVPESDETSGPVASITAARVDTSGSIGTLSANATKQHLTKIKALEKKSKEDALKIRKLEAAAARVEGAVASAAGVGAPSVHPQDVKVTERALANAEKKWKKAADEAEKQQRKELLVLHKQLTGLQTELESTLITLGGCTRERDELKQRLLSMGEMSQALEAAQSRAADADRLEKEFASTAAHAAVLENMYKEEQLLRKKYWNMMEDMKGKIRVFARCRPFATYEKERGCSQVVTFEDETTLTVDSSRGPKQFIYDAVFTPESSQAELFDDMKRLVQSAVDGYNVCIFAYGQTGSGKTFTMTGTPDLPGVTPRTINELFALKAAMGNKADVRVSCYFVELYLDNLRDLLHARRNPSDQSPPKLDVKLDAKKMVFVKNAVTEEANSAEALATLFEQGNKMRKVGGTKMNAESSRSHSIFSIIVEVTNQTTKKTTVGKISLVDLAGSERQDKTGATDDRLKEAMSINKSLSALGDVISALSTGEKFIPYRNNKLTQLMQDSLGGKRRGAHVPFIACI
jgi:hypothetical protein